jgi:hypothetical protein
MGKNMSIRTKEKKGLRVNIGFKIAGIAIFFVLLAVVVLTLFIIKNMRNVGSESAVMMGKEKIKGDIVSFESIVKMEYGELLL